MYNGGKAPVMSAIYENLLKFFLGDQRDGSKSRLVVPPACSPAYKWLYLFMYWKRGCSMSVGRLLTVMVVLNFSAAGLARADDLVYRYEGDVAPYDESAGWILSNPCDPPCIELPEKDRFVLQ